MNAKDRQTVWKVLANISRFALAAVFIFSGFIKANDPYGTVFKLQEYVAAFGLTGIPFITLIIIAIALAFAEFFIGVHLLFGMSQAIVSKLALLFMAAMTLLTAYIWAFSPVSDCGCFGDVIILSNGATFAKNIILLVAAIVNAKYCNLYVKLVGENTKWLLTLFCVVYVFIYSIVCLYTLPWLDTSPYKIGTDMRSEEGREATAGFYMTDIETDEDVTDDIVYKDGYLFLLSIPDLMHADEGCVDLVNEIYEYSADNGYAFYCATGSADKAARDYWIDHTGAEYPFYESDASELKTMVRSSPGLLLLKDGVIIGKWSNYTLPDENVLTARLEKLPIGKLNPELEQKKTLDLLLKFLLPLLVIIIMDRIGSGFAWYRKWRKKTEKLQLEQIGEQINIQKTEKLSNKTK